MPDNTLSEAKQVIPCQNEPIHPVTDNYSDCDSYAGVEQISDEEEEEPEIEKAEERAIISSGDRDLIPNTRNSTEMPWEGFSDYSITAEDMTLFGQDSFSQEAWCLSTEFTKEEDSYETNTYQKARSIQFDSSDDEFDMFDDVFPDIFIDKDRLDSSFRRQIDHDDVSDDGSYWEHDEVDTMYGSSYINGNSTMDLPDCDKFHNYETDSTFTGYESDISGETTEDDLSAEYYAQQGQNTTSISENDLDIDKDTHAHSPLRAPRLYSWKHTSDKPFATVSSNCKTMVVFNVQDSSLKLNKPSSKHPNTLAISRIESSPATLDTKNLLLSPPQNLLLTDPNGLVSGFSEGFDTCLARNGTEIALYASSGYGSDNFNDENCAETNQDLDEFINFESDDDSTRGTEAAEPSSDCAIANTSNSSLSSRVNNEDQVHPLISHFNRGVVGSWRQKQNTHKLLHRNIVSQDSLAFGGNRFMEGTLRGVKNGRLKHANTPITPIRKRRIIPSMTRAMDGLANPFMIKEKYDTHGYEVWNGKRRKMNI